MYIDPHFVLTSHTPSVDANRTRFWGLFWIDVSDFAAAERDFKKIADQIHPGTTHQNVEQALSALAEVNHKTHPWLLILDNADDQRGNYARFFPSVPGGSIILTSRNHGCDVYETVGSCELESVSFEDSVDLLRKAANLYERHWDSYRQQAETIAKLLGSHTLALIQAGAFLSRDVRNWDDYHNLFDENRPNLLETSWDKVQSKYGNVYATFEVSARTLESDGSTAAKDALCLLEVFAMFHHRGFPISILEDASKGLPYAETEGYSNSIYSISAGLANLLPAFLTESRLSTLRLQAGLYYLEALSFIKVSTDTQDNVKLVSMHPLAHAWAKDRLDQRLQEKTWMMTGSIIALSVKGDPNFTFYYDFREWERRIVQLQSHMSFFLDNRPVCQRRDAQAIEKRQVEYVIAVISRRLELYENMEVFLLEVFKTLDAEPSNVENFNLLPFYEEMAVVWKHLGKYPSSLDLWNQILSLQEARLFHESSLLRSRHEIATTYLHSGAYSKAIQQLQSIISKLKENSSPDDPELLTSEHDLARAYLRNEQIEAGTELLEHVVQIRKTILPESSPDLLANQHELGSAQYRSGRFAEAQELFEHVARIEKSTCSPTDPSRLLTLSWLVHSCMQNNQPEKAKAALDDLENSLRSLPDDDVSQREYGPFLATWKERLRTEDELLRRCKNGPGFAFGSEPDQISTGHGFSRGVDSQAGGQQVVEQRLTDGEVESRQQGAASRQHHRRHRRRKRQHDAGRRADVHREGTYSELSGPNDSWDSDITIRPGKSVMISMHDILVGVVIRLG